MKKTITGCLAFFMCVPVIAGWVQVGRSDNMLSYFDPQTIQRSGNSVKAWILYDFFSTDSNGATSQKSQEEFDCQRAESRTTFSTIYSGRMGSGQPIDSWKPQGGWTPIPPETLRWSISKKVC